MELKITDVPCEMIEIGKQIVSEKRYLYTDEELENLRHYFTVFGGDYTDDGDFIYQYVYDHWMYGVNADEECNFRFKNKTHAEKSEYLTWDNRFQYYAVLNNKKDIHILENKYEAYLKLKKYYKRDAILVSDKGDLNLFRDFVKKHGRVIVKPVNLCLTIGLRWLNANEITDYSVLLNEILESVKKYAQMDFCSISKTSIFTGALDEIIESVNDYTKNDSVGISKPSLIVEELLADGQDMPSFNPEMLSIIRCTTVLTQEGVEFFYPAIRTYSMALKGKQGIDYEEMDEFICAIDKKSGIITSGGYNYFGNIFTKHPCSGQIFEGTQLPEWDKLLEMLTEAALELPSLRYIGWDVAYSKNGWCIIEGNTNGEFFSQMVFGHGFKKEFEKLIDWKISDQLWKHPLLRKEHVW